VISSLKCFFEPKSVAVIGASEKPGTIGRALMTNLLERFKGKIYPVNIKYDQVFGLKCYKSVKEIPDEVDLAVIAVPAPVVVNVARECGEKGIKGLLVISAGFKEIGEEGAKREEELVKVVEKYGMRLIGPNCLGIYDAHTGLDTIFNPSDRQAKPEPGPVAFISQSGALGAAVLDWIAITGIGLSKFISYGNAADVDESTLIEYLAEDPKTSVITCYIEGVRDGRKFMNAIRKAIKNKKPVIVLKAGKTEHGVRAVSSHTGSIAGSYEVYEAALKQVGAIVVDELEDLIVAAKVLSWQPPARGNRIAIVTNGGGAGVLATDAIERSGMKMAKLGQHTIEKLRSVLPLAASPYNPVDILGDAPVERYENAIKITASDPNVDALIVITIMQSPALNADQLRQRLKAIREDIDKPMVMVAPGGEYTEKHSSKIEKEAKIPVFKTPEQAVKAIRIAVEWGKILRKYGLIG